MSELSKEQFVNNFLKKRLNFRNDFIKEAYERNNSAFSNALGLGAMGLGGYAGYKYLNTPTSVESILGASIPKSRLGKALGIGAGLGIGGTALASGYNLHNLNKKIDRAYNLAAANNNRISNFSLGNQSQPNFFGNEFNPMDSIEEKNFNRLTRNSRRLDNYINKIQDIRKGNLLYKTQNISKNIYENLLKYLKK